MRANAVESLNFNLSWLLYAIVSVILLFIGIGILLLLALGIAYVIRSSSPRSGPTTASSTATR